MPRDEPSLAFLARFYQSWQFEKFVDSQTLYVGFTMDSPWKRKDNRKWTTAVRLDSPFGESLVNPT